MILALLGNNSMQSEFACHISLGGKFFCRACWVKGTDASADPEEESGGPNMENLDEVASDNEGAASSEVTEDGGSDGESMPGKKGKSRRKRVLETMTNMVDRVKSFIKVSSCIT